MARQGKARRIEPSRAESRETKKPETVTRLRENGRILARMNEAGFNR